MRNHLYSVEIEKNCIASLLKYPTLLEKIPDNISASDFYTDINRYIYPFLTTAIRKGGSLNPTLLADIIKQTGYSPKEDLSILEYLDSLLLLPLAQEAVFPSFKELKKYSICRDLDTTAENIKKEIAKNLDKSAHEIIQNVDNIYGSKADLYRDNETQFTDVYGTLAEFLKQRSTQIVEERGIKSPFPIFNQYYGGFRDGNVYVWASRAKQGKSTLLGSLAYGLAEQKTWDNKTIKVLYLDTEMSTEEYMLRQASALAQIPFWYVDTCKFIDNPVYNAKISEELRKLQVFTPRVFHEQVQNKNTNDIISLIKRWYYQHAADGQSKPVIIYDYLKLTGEKVSNDWKEYQVIGEKINKLKEVATFIGAPLLTAVQINRNGVEKGTEDVADDNSVIAMSDRISWFASYLGIFRKKTRKEWSEEGGKNAGSHKLISLDVRHLGKDGDAGHNEFVKMPDGSFKKNYINFNIQNFRLTEGSSLLNIIALEKDTKVIKNPEEDKKADTELF